MRSFRDSVRLAWVDHELNRHALSSQRPVEAGGLAERHTNIVLPV